MNTFNLSKLAMSTAVLLAFGAVGSVANADVIYNSPDNTPATATLALGVNPDGSLNAAPNVTVNANATGTAFRFPDGTFRDATAPGCLCEGWGVSVGAPGSGTSGFANVSIDGGPNNLTILPQVTSPSGSVPSTLSSVSLTSLPGLAVTQLYTVSSKTSALFQDHVTITNTTGADVTDLRYVRVMDWDVPPTEFSEFVTIKGTATTTLLEQSHDDGFHTANPLVFAPADGILVNATIDFTDSGPTDHGAYFRFNFGTLANGASQVFDIFYGAADTEAGALAAISAAGLELYSLGQSNGGQLTGSPATYIFGFTGVGGVPTQVPEPATLALLSLGVLGLGLSRARRSRG